MAAYMDDDSGYRSLDWMSAVCTQMELVQCTIDELLYEIEVFSNVDDPNRLDNNYNSSSAIGHASLGASSLTNAISPRRRQQILGDTSLGNEVVATVVDTIGKSDQATRLILSTLKRHFLFSKLHDYDFEDIIGQMQEDTAEAGDVIIQQGEPGDKFYIMEDGACEIIREEDQTVLDTLSAGSYFGDSALIHNAPRAATIRATAYCTLWTLDRAFFRQAMLTSNANAGTYLTEFLPKLRLFGAKMPFFAGESSDRLIQLAKSLTEKTYEEGEYIITQGEVGEHLFILGPKSKLGGGRVKVTETLPDGTEKTLNTLNENDEGTLFGDLALIKKQPRARNIIAMEKIKVFSLNKKDFGALLGHKVTEMMDMNELRMLQAISVFSKLSDHRLQLVKTEMTYLRCWQDRRIVTNADAVYVVMDGLFETSDGRTLKVGEVPSRSDLNAALVPERPSPAPAVTPILTLTCRSEEEGVLGVVARSVISQHLAEQITDPATASGESVVSEEDARMEALMKVEALLVETTKQREDTARRRMEKLGAMLRLDASGRGLECLQVLGQGTFGTVYLVRHADSGTMLACKCLDKVSLTPT